MRISNQWVALCCVIAAASARADEITLSGGASRLTGTLRAIGEDGVAELVSELSPEPLKLRDGMIREVRFHLEKPAADPSPAMVELKNGDLLPVTVESLDERRLVVESPQAGRLEIPRDAISSLQVGIRKNHVIYSGPKRLEDWSHEAADMNNWGFERNSLVSRGPSTATRVVELPKDFILRFKLRWQERSIPNFQVYFADPLREKGELADRYYLQFGAAGLEIKRESSKGKRYSTVAQRNILPNQFPENEIRVEIRVKRQTGHLALFVNDVPEGGFVDTAPEVPDGSGISFVCNTQNGAIQEISAIEILEHDDKPERHVAEERGDPKNDSLITREEDRFAGRLLSISGAGSEAVFRFKGDFQDEPMEVPATEVSTVFFAGEAAKPGGRDSSKPGLPYRLRLRGGGSLRVSSCIFTAESVSAAHPLLGKIVLRREGVDAMERDQTEPEKKSEP